MRILTTAALVASAIGVPAFAQNIDEICNSNLSAEQLVGTYTLSVGNVLLYSNEKIVPLKDSQEMAATISLIGGQLVLESGEYSVELNIVGADYEPDWNWKPMQGIMELSSEEFSYVFGCPVRKFPRLVGEGSVMSGGSEFTTKYYLIVHEINDAGAEMFGILRGEGGGISMKRAVQISTQ